MVMTKSILKNIIYLLHLINDSTKIECSKNSQLPYTMKILRQKSFAVVISCSTQAFFIHLRTYYNFHCFHKITKFLSKLFLYICIIDTYIIIMFIYVHPVVAVMAVYATFSTTWLTNYFIST